MYACCVRDPKHKVKRVKTKMMPRKSGDLSFTYDIIQAYESKYLAQVTLENGNPLGRLDQWNLTWEWMRGEFIYTMRGAYTHKMGAGDCIFGKAAQFYQGLDFSQVMNCQKKPVIADLPLERANDTKTGKLPYCCRNGTLLPTIMDPSQSKSIFQLEVFKLPPEMNRTALYPPERWKIIGLLNPDYKCGAPIRVEPTEFPDPSGLPATTSAIATWQVVCNITKHTKTSSHCCVSFSAYYNSSVVPCNTCACGCSDDNVDATCNKNAPAMLLPSEAILVPFKNRTMKAVAWAKIKHFHVPRPLPCGDNCGVSVNWHLLSDYRNGWSVRITLFNWEKVNFANWFAAFQMKRSGRGFEKAYSFNGTLFKNLNHTIFLQGVPGMNYLVGEMNGTNPKVNPPVPGKQQSVISFTKKLTPGLNIAKGDGFPSRVFFNGDECSLPTYFPVGRGQRNLVCLLQITILHILVISFLVLNNAH
ncbi:hypothetical protein SAY86_030402 [Trapa natans]|uniref:COBRA-like protein n=1 Tax=Trapa natans TaxID=22666 RepID=A0AAN7RH41_TRANT|nr:hypothetical protein SAY86_030402 [Trapa natans]